MSSINIWVKNGIDKSNLYESNGLDLIVKEEDNLKIVIHSTHVIDKYIKEEEDHDHFEVSNERGQKLTDMSSGERKKALINYLMNLSPDVIVLDNPLDSLDNKGQMELVEKLGAIAGQVQLINVMSRQRDALPFATQNYVYENSELLAVDRFHLSEATKPYSEPLPTAIQEFSNEVQRLVSFNNVNVAYHDRPIIKNINWEIKKGDFWQLIGPNGAGKTTILSMITGHNHKAYGQDIELFDFNKGRGESIWDIKKYIGYYTATMTHNFWRNQSVEQMVVSGFVDSIGLYQTPSELQLKKAQQWLSLIEIADQAKKPFIKLDNAHQRLVLIVRAMVKHPLLLILDEPTADLDDENVLLVIALINKIAAESQASIVFVSHREEDGLSPNKIYELIPEPDGSIGVIR